MAQQDTEEATTESHEEPAGMTVGVVPVGPVDHTTPAATLDAAFMLLCQAMANHLDTQDDIPSMMHAEEIMGWYTNGNTAIAWQHAVLLLETVIGVPLRG